MPESTFVSQAVLLTATQYINFSSAAAVFAIGVFLYAKDRRNVVNQLVLLIAIFLSFWSFSSTLSDVMHSPRPAMTWARLAIIGPYWFSAIFHVFSHYFPAPQRRLSFLKAAIILAPSVAVCFLVASPLNVVEVRMAEWGTDFTPGPLYLIGTVYLLLNVIFAARNFWKVQKGTTDPVVKRQITLVFWAISLVVFSLLLTNAILPLAFNYAKASVFGPAASLFFVILIGFAVLRHGLLNAKVIATELFTFALLYVLFVQLFGATTVADAVLRMLAFAAAAVFSVLLVHSVNTEVQRREELQKLSAKLAEANVHLKELDNLKSEFISIASHQLRTPISVIKGYLTLFLDGTYGKFEPTANEKLDQMYVMVERLVHMINNLLSVSRIEGNRIEFACAMFDVGRLVKDVVDEMNVKAGQKKMEIVLAPLPAKPLMVYSDASKLAEVLTNLLDNAIKYSDVGPIDVRIRQQAKRGVTVISIKDKGVGMTPDETKHMFEKFFRAKEPLVAHKSGTGLGLYICAKFMKAMGGEAVIEKTEPGKGSTFSVIVPMRPGIECKLPQDEEE